jgi:Fic family protein
LGYYSFVPYDIPPKIKYDQRLINFLSETDRLLGELSGPARMLRNPYLLIAPYMRREVVSSSRIERNTGIIK